MTNILKYLFIIRHVDFNCLIYSLSKQFYICKFTENNVTSGYQWFRILRKLDNNYCDIKQWSIYQPKPYSDLSPGAVVIFCTLRNLALCCVRRDFIEKHETCDINTA